MNAANFKEAAHRLVDALPDNATWDDVMRKAYERQAIESGLADSEAGRVTDVEAVREKYGLPHQVGRSGGCAGGIPRGTAIAR